MEKYRPLQVNLQLVLIKLDKDEKFSQTDVAQITVMESDFDRTLYEIARDAIAQKLSEDKK